MRFSVPSALRPGDRIGLVAPASPFDSSRFYSGTEVIRRLGFEPVFTDRIFTKQGYLAGTDTQRARQIQEFFTDPGIRALWAARGGYGSIRLLEKLDFRAIAATPKIFIGCSDITALLVQLCFRGRMTSFHGPMVTSLADADQQTLDGLVSAVCGLHRLKIHASGGRVITGGQAAGPVAGGNLAVLCHLLATHYFPEVAGCILFIEDTGEKPYRIDRMLTQMRLAGCFDQIAGLAAGSFKDCGGSGEIDRILKDVLSGFSFPVVSGFPAGHGTPNLTLPLGAEAVLDSSTMTLTYRQGAVSMTDKIPGGFRNEPD